MDVKKEDGWTGCVVERLDQPWGRSRWGLEATLEKVGTVPSVVVSDEPDIKGNPLPHLNLRHLEAFFVLPRSLSCPLFWALQLGQTDCLGHSLFFAVCAVIITYYRCLLLPCQPTQPIIITVPNLLRWRLCLYLCLFPD